MAKALKQKTALSAKTTLEAKTALVASPKKRKPPRKLEQKTAQELIREADKYFSKYVRLRDSGVVNGQWVGVCITCPRQMVVLADNRWTKGPQNGHLIGRGHFNLRYDDENCNLQCAHCNAFLDKDEMIQRYRRAVDDKYGLGTYKKLKAMSKLPDARKHPTKAELLGIIEDCKTQIDWLLNH